MTILEEVQKAKTPREAILILANAIDALETDGWNDEWELDNAQPFPPPVVFDTDSAKTKIAEIDEQLSKGNLDPEDVQALDAKRRLLKDGLRAPMDAPLDEGERTNSEEVGDAGEVVVNLPTASEKCKRERRTFATEKLKLDEELGSKDFIEAYVKGGPQWLYYGNRDLVMQYPPEFKMAMINDINEFAPLEAIEIGRDLLKDKGAEGPDRTMEQILG